MQLTLLATVVAALEAAGIPYMVTGSFASTFHGEPRMTRDIDLVIEAEPGSVDVFTRQFDQGDYYIDDAVGAVRRGDMFNVIEIRSGWKVDLILRKDRPFSVAEFARRRRVDLGGVEAFVASPEDSILSKLEWSKDSQSEQQLRDVLMVLAANRDTIDREYLDHWARVLGVETQLLSAYDRVAGTGEA